MSEEITAKINQHLDASEVKFYLAVNVLIIFYLKAQELQLRKVTNVFYLTRININ